MSGATGDLFDVLSGELTALRRSVEHYGGTTLSKTEAADLNKSLVQAVGRMEKAARDAPRALVSAFGTDRAQMADETIEATTQAAERVLKDVRDKLFEERLELSRAAGEARRAAWMYFGGFWVWLAAMLAIGAFLGLLAAYVTETAESLLSTEQEVRIGCGRSWGSGQVVELEGGASYCAHWLVTPDEAARRAAEN